MGLQFVISLNILGVPIALQTSSADMRDEVVRLLKRFVVEKPQDRALELAVVPTGESMEFSFEDRVCVIQSKHSWPRLDDVVMLIIKRERPDLVFLHASGVCDDLNCALFVGASTAGKTTLALALARRGYRLISDDTAPINLQTKVVSPFVLGNQIRPHTVELLRRIDERPLLYRASNECDIPLGCLFCIDFLPSSEMRSAPLSGGLDSWNALQKMVLGFEGGQRHAGEIVVKQQGAEQFRREPQITPMRAADACAFLCRHAHMPTMAPGEILGGMSNLLAATPAFRLVPGEIFATMELVSRTLSGLRN